MAITKSAQAVLSSQALNTGDSQLNSNYFAIGYGVTGWVKAYGTNTPSGGLVYTINGAADNSGTAVGLLQPGVSVCPSSPGSTNAVTSVFSFGPGGLYGDWSHYQVTITPPTGNNATVEVQAMSTTGL